MTTNYPVISPKKLIEVALPLDAINAAAKEEKAVPRRGHPQTLHYWWARRPLAAARAVIFGQLVNDPSWKWELEHPGDIPPNHLKASWAASRGRLFAILEDLVKWGNSTNEIVLEKAREEIRKSWRETCEVNSKHPEAEQLFNPEKLPGVHDPFAGGGTIPLEAQRLGIDAYGTDLNPIAVLINKALIEIPSRFACMPPVNPESRNKFVLGTKQWNGSSGLAEDVRYYGAWMQVEAKRRLENLYSPVEVTPEMSFDRTDLEHLVGKKLTPIAWLWARTVKSPNPAFSHVDVPLASTFVLSNKVGKEIYIEPEVNMDHYILKVKQGTPTSDATKGTKAGRGSDFRCIMSDTVISGEYIKTEAKAGRMGQRLMAVIVEGGRSRVYVGATPEQEAIAKIERPKSPQDIEFFQQALGFRVGNYGMTKWSDLFTSRQLAVLTTFSDLLLDLKERVKSDSDIADATGEILGENRSSSYANGVVTYLGCALSRLASYNNTICVWNMKGGSVAQIFARQAISMTWDFIEINPLEKMSGNWAGGIEWVSDVLDKLVAKTPGIAMQADAGQQEYSLNRIVSTDPPYYDNIGYADLSDFFYVWLRPFLRPIYPDVFSTLTVPKAEELVATPIRHGTKREAESFFLNGMSKAMHALAVQSHPAFPVTIYYAFKQSETDSESGTISTGWETFLEAVIGAGFSTTGTWPVRTERDGGVRNNDRNSLASSIVLVCRRRSRNSRTISRREFLRELNLVLPEALDEMTKGSGDDRSPVAPVDLSQAIIGPGMAVFSKYEAVLEADGSPMTVRTAMQLINRFLAEDDFDADTRFCLHWFEQYGWETAKFGDADTLARAKGTSVEGVKQSGVLYSSGGNVRLMKWAEYPSDWHPQSDQRLPVWEVLHQLIRVFNTDGETGAAAVFATVQSKAEAARQLAYRLYTLCERKNWAEDARAYNEVVTSWSGIEAAASKEPAMKQGELFE